MKVTKKLFFTATAIAALTASVWAENPASPAPAGKDGAPTAAAASPAPASPAPPTITAADVQSLKDALASQQLQIQQLTEQLQRQQAWQQAQKSADQTTSQPAPQQVAEVAPGIAIQQDGTPATAQNSQDTTPSTSPSSMEGPLTIHFKGI